MSRSPLAFDEKGLVPVVVQDRLTGEIRMVAYATEEAVRATLASGRATFFSRSRGELWEKGRTSGNEVRVGRVLVDCDADCLVYSGDPVGTTCHTGAASCFFRALEPAPEGRAPGSSGTAAPGDGTDAAALTLTEPGVEPQTLLARLEAMLEARKASTGAASYTKSLYERGAPAIGAKIVEEAGELARAVAGEGDDRVVSEAADVVFHLLVALRWRGITWRQVLGELARRLGTSGHAEKAARRPGA